MAIMSRTILAASAALALALALAGCDQGGGDRRAGASAATTTAGRPDGARARIATPMVEGKPIWADNRQHTASENLAYQFAHWGDTVGAKDARDYARKARAFIDHPPVGAERRVRGNGDTMIYDEASNILCIYRRDGAPRLFRKPPNGKADWAKAKTEADASPGQGAQTRSRRYHAPGMGPDHDGA